MMDRATAGEFGFFVESLGGKLGLPSLVFLTMEKSNDLE